MLDGSELFRNRWLDAGKDMRVHLMVWVVLSRTMMSASSSCFLLCALVLYDVVGWDGRARSGKRLFLILVVFLIFSTLCQGSCFYTPSLWG